MNVKNWLASRRLPIFKRTSAGLCIMNHFFYGKFSQRLLRIYLLKISSIPLLTFVIYWVILYCFSLFQSEARKKIEIKKSLIN